MLFKTTCYHKIRAMTKRLKLVQGGQGAGKNWGIQQILLEKALEKRRIITIVTNTFRNLEDGAVQDYRSMFFAGGLNFKDYYNSQRGNLHWGQSQIQFRYVADNIKDGGKSKRRNILYVNECNKIGYAAIEPYIARTAEDIYFDLNPDFETWVHTEMEVKPDCEKIIVTWKDNQLIPKAEMDYIESRKHLTDWYRVYGEGQTGFISEGLIYKFRKVDKIPEGVKRIASGMDYGHSPDKTVLVDLYSDGAKIYVDEIFSENNLMAEKIIGVNRMSVVDKMEEVNHDKFWHTIGDSSGALEILNLQQHGYNITPIRKYAGSVLDGIKLTRSFDLHVTTRSHNLIKGLESYLWKQDKNGKWIPEPDGHEPDEIAAMRYAIMGSRSFGFV